MDYAWARDFTLELINQYSIAGEKVQEGYNNQADYLARIPKLLDDGQMYMATTSARMRTVVPLCGLARQGMGAWVMYHLPEDCWQVCSGGLIRTDGPVLQRYHGYHLVGNDGIAVPGDLDGKMMLEYYRYPALLGKDPMDDDRLDNVPEAQMALPYYAAAHLVMHDNAFAYQALYNEFEAKLARLGEQPQAEMNTVEDAYSPSEWRHDR